MITKDGPKPISVGDLPVAVRGLVQQIKSFEVISAEAAVIGDYNTALLAMNINPLVPSDKIAKQLLGEMLEAHKEYLPQFFNKQKSEV
jgi:6-phospho-beta-glucosidase